MNHNFLKISIFLFILLFVTGCSNSTKAVNSSVQIQKQPQYQIPKKINPPKVKSKGSLFSNQGGSLFTDRKDLQIGDIVYVLINEGTQGTTEGTNKGRITESGSTKEQRLLENDKTVTPLSVTPNDESPGLLKSIISGINGLLGIGISTGTSTSNFNAESSSEATDELINDIATVVTQQYQNGNYFLEGEKDIVVRGQRVTIKLSGVMNPEDLNVKSEVNSNRLANLKVMLYKTGTESDIEEKPWGTKVIETISPF